MPYLIDVPPPSAEPEEFKKLLQELAKLPQDDWTVISAQQTARHMLKLSREFHRELALRKGKNAST